MTQTRSFVVVLLICALPIAGRADLLGDLRGAKVAIVVHSLRGDSRFERTAEAKLAEILQDNGARVLDREEAERLKDGWDDLSDSSYVIVAEDFLREASDYEVDILVRGYALTDVQRALGGYWSAGGQFVLELIGSDARVLAAKAGPSLGSPGFPPSDGTNETAAGANCIQRAVAATAELLDLAILAPPVPTRLAFRIEPENRFEVGGHALSIAVHPVLPRCLVGMEDGRTQVVSLENGDRIGMRELSGSPVVWVGFSRDPVGAFAIDESGNAVELGEELEWADVTATGAGRVMTGAVSPDATRVLLVSRGERRGSSGQLVLVDILQRRHWDLSVELVDESSSVAFGRDASTAYLGCESGCFEIKIDDEGGLRIGKQFVSSATGLTNAHASVQGQAVAPNGALIAIAVQTQNIDLLRNRRDDRVEIQLVDPERGNAYATLEQKDDVPLRPKDVTGMTFGPDWRFLAVGSKENLIRIWNTETGQQDFSERADGVVNRVSFGVKGTRLVGLHEEGLLVWRAVSE